MAWDRADFYDAELARHNRHLRDAADVGVADRVLDIGCGAGQTTREAARAALQGEVVGVDTSAEMLEVARRRSAAEGLRNVVFEQADAQFHAFPAASFDLCISRFGVMFFADSAAAFANISRAMRPAARLVWMVWQSRERNEWSGAIRQALAPGTAVSAGGPNPFSLGAPPIAKDLLSAAGFNSIDFADVREPVFYGPDVDAASDALAGLYLVKNALAHTDEPPGKPLQRLRDLLEAHMTPEGVFFDSRAWIITARRAAG
ncbi:MULTISPECIES: class I SAM-dependent methyltransferase [Rhizobium]|uniref:class I SAM-dependent methyltransferase n=1 Tax=Rhizobium TaxID=379 RepID=UPI0007EA500D|nr:MULTISPECIES: class I SAM-dependent methyltransferase [Rhizobium]ANK95093.1 SAM-dependent methyltransferase protein [Rhizobium sp. N6212]ANL01144.1 SAM-dependent methyltransferase protein [Rhizobium sp. N621]ANL07267.1 SAM-dependent methyltransferase protein [Rhizobium esperanzae]ANL13437.1 SAM-dependent methyltransferase protein [Rhizobium sp. N1341]ANL25422.1 SAM-dependent methyltransferase protein [Rhizobium sp. N113]